MNDRERRKTFEEWLHRHGAILHHVARGFAPDADRGDLMQELLLALWKAIPAFRSASLPSTFLYRVAHHTALTWQRTRRNYDRRLIRYREEAESTVVPAPADPREEVLEQLYAAIRELSALDRSLILLSLDGVSYREIADLHGLTVSNVGVRLNRIRHRLTRELKEGNHELL